MPACSRIHLPREAEGTELPAPAFGLAPLRLSWHSGSDRQMTAPSVPQIKKKMENNLRGKKASIARPTTKITALILVSEQTGRGQRRSPVPGRRQGQQGGRLLTQPLRHTLRPRSHHGQSSLTQWRQRRCQVHSGCRERDCLPQRKPWPRNQLSSPPRRSVSALGALRRGTQAPCGRPRVHP